MKTIKFEELPVIFDVKTLAQILNISATTAYKLTKEESFPSFRIGRKVLINKAEFLLWLDGRCFIKKRRS